MPPKRIISPNKYEPKRIAAILNEVGCVSFPMFTASEVKELNESLLKEMNAFPEYITTPTNETTGSRFVMGAFGALGNPASFHCPTVRKIRLAEHKRIKKVMKALIKLMYDSEASKRKNMETMIDRLGYRIKGDTLGSESYHRDESIIHHPDDFMMGGWVNLDVEQTQYFSFCPGTHSSVRDEPKTGFVTIPRKEAAEFRKVSALIEIPPGHHVLFFSHIVHEVKPGKIKKNTLRLFSGYRITETTRPMLCQCPVSDRGSGEHKCPGNGTCHIRNIVHQRSIALPSGQHPPLFSSNHYRWRDRLIEFGSQFHPEFKKTVNGKDGVVWQCAKPKIVEGLVDLAERYPSKFRDAPYQEYTDKELSHHLPRPLFRKNLNSKKRKR